MLDLVLLKVGDTHFMAVVLLSMGCAAGVLMALMPLLQTDNLARRMRQNTAHAGIEFEKIGRLVEIGDSVSENRDFTHSSGHER